jgi:hypothetical protein
MCVLVRVLWVIISTHKSIWHTHYSHTHTHTAACVLRVVNPDLRFNRKLPAGKAARFSLSTQIADEIKGLGYSRYVWVVWVVCVCVCSVGSVGRVCKV